MPRRKYKPGEIPYNKTPPEIEDRAVELYVEAGWTMDQVGDLLGICGSTVRRILIDHDIPRRDKSEAQRGIGRLPHSEMEKTVFLYTEMKFGSKTIGRILGREPTAIRARLKRAGVPIRSKSEAAHLAQAFRTPEARRLSGQKRWHGIPKEERVAQMQAIKKRQTTERQEAA